MPKAGDTVSVHYKGTLSDGSEFDSSEGREPLEFELGSGQVIPGFDAAVAAMEIDQTVTVTIPAAEAYGDSDPEAVREVPRSMFGDDNPEVDWMVELGTPDGHRLAARVVEVGDEVVALDFNHPLAGQDLTFELTLVSVTPGQGTSSGIILP